MLSKSLDPNEECWVSTVRIEEDMGEAGDSGPEENGKRGTQYFASTHMRKDNSGLEDELEYFWEAPNLSDPYEREEDRW
jgi:hypothetical protein